MNIIPVIDIKDGQVVKAVAGDRKRYQPIRSAICSSSEPWHVVKTFIQTFGAETIYIADLNAIENTHDNFRIIQEIATQFPDHNFWMDAGFVQVDQIHRWTQMANLKPVIGSESQTCLSSIKSLMKYSQILSLDFKQDQFLGPPALLSESTSWPEKVIVMSLNAVGTNTGPDCALIKKISRLNMKSSIYAAGGVRNSTDLQLLKEKELHGVLIASSLHNEVITAKDFQHFH